MGKVQKASLYSQETGRSRTARDAIQTELPKKDDAEDARICCLLALDRHAGLKQLIPHGELGGELRSIARDDKRACRDERRLLNRLRRPAGGLPGRADHRR